MGRKKTADMPEGEKKLEYLKQYIRKTLQKSGLYKTEMAHQIELTASTILAFRKIRDAILDEGQVPIITETSREGDERKRENPIYNLYVKFADVLRRDLRALRMNQELTKGKDDKEEDIKEDDVLMKLLQSDEDEDGGNEE